MLFLGVVRLLSRGTRRPLADSCREHARRTFVDNVDRLNFDNWAEHQALYPEGKPIFPYPRAKARRQAPVDIRVALAARAVAIGAIETLAVA